MTRDQRNLHPRPPAVFAMYHWSADYAAQRGGVADFYEKLHPRDQLFCNDAVTAILNAALSYGVLLKDGKEQAPKASPRLPKRRSRK